MLRDHSSCSAWRSTLALFVVVCFTIDPREVVADKVEEQKAALRATFQKLDRDSSNLLSEEEYLAHTGEKAVLQRDFKLFDFDGDGSLSLAEFSVTPGVISPGLRGPIPDPVENIYLAAEEAMNAGFDDERNKNTRFHRQMFVYNYLQSINPSGGSVSFDSSLDQLSQKIDVNGDGQINREEALRFLEIQVGKRDISGQLLREPSGRVLKLPVFQWLDQNRDGKITKAEYLARKTHASATQEFEQGDADSDGFITMAEFAAPDWLGYADPILEFHTGDTDRDGLLSIEELTAVTPEYRRNLIPKGFAAFDGDGDGKWSLEEYRLSTVGNYMATWESALSDKNSDRKLTFDEFVFPKSDCRLLWRYFFHQFDQDGDLALSKQEYNFRVIPPQTLHRMTLDGKTHELIFLDEGFPKCGSPDVSPDSQWILFDSFPPGGIRQSRICLMTIDGKDVQDLCDGTMPNWSADGKYFTTSRNSGLWIMNRDGSEETKIDDGWAAQWSTDGKQIAYTKGATIWSYDIATGEKREVLAKDDHPYRYLYYNMAWSPDSSRLLLKAYETSASDSDLISIDMQGDKPDLKVHLEGEKNLDADIAWMPDGKQILLSRTTPENNKRLLHKMNLETGDAPELMPGINPNITYGGIVVSPDERWIIMATHDPNLPEFQE